jgi:hypothetical protein
MALGGKEGQSGPRHDNARRPRNRASRPGRPRNPVLDYRFFDVFDEAAPYYVAASIVMRFRIGAQR